MTEKGYDLTVGRNHSKVVSVSTGAQRDGTHQFYINLPAGSGVERHLHGYARLDADGKMEFAGARLKERKGQHLGDGLVVAHSTEEIARLQVDVREGGVASRLLQHLDSSWLVTSASTHDRPVRHRKVQLPGPVDISSAEYSIAMFDARSRPAEVPGERVVLTFAGVHRFGVSITLISTK